MHVSVSDSQLQQGFFEGDSPPHNDGDEEFPHNVSNVHHAVLALDQDEKIQIWAYAICWWKVV